MRKLQGERKSSVYWCENKKGYFPPREASARKFLVSCRGTQLDRTCFLSIARRFLVWSDHEIVLRSFFSRLRHWLSFAPWGDISFGNTSTHRNTQENRKTALQRPRKKWWKPKARGERTFWPPGDFQLGQRWCFLSSTLGREKTITSSNSTEDESRCFVSKFVANTKYWP